MILIMWRVKYVTCLLSQGMWCIMAQKSSLLSVVREKLRVKNYSIRIRTIQELMGHKDVRTTQIVSPGIMPL